MCFGLNLSNYKFLHIFCIPQSINYKFREFQITRPSNPIIFFRYITNIMYFYVTNDSKIHCIICRIWYRIQFTSFKKIASDFTKRLLITNCEQNDRKAVEFVEKKTKGLPDDAESCLDLSLSFQFIRPSRFLARPTDCGLNRPWKEQIVSRDYPPHCLCLEPPHAISLLVSVFSASIPTDPPCRSLFIRLSLTPGFQPLHPAARNMSHRVSPGLATLIVSRWKV